MRSFLIASALLATLSSYAQPLQLDYKELDKKYKGNNAIILNRDQHLRIETDGKGTLKIESDQGQQTYYIDNRSAGIVEREIPYSPAFYTIKKLEANTYIPDGKGKFTKLPVKEFKDEGRVDNGSVFYDGAMYRKFQFPALKQGAITETRYTYSYTEPGMLGAFYFMWGVPHYKLKYTVTVSDDVEIGYSFFGDSSFVTKTVVKKGKNTIYTWEASDVPALKSYSDAVDERYYEPHVFVYIKSYKTGKGWQSLFGTPNDLYKYDYKYISKCNKDAVIPGMQSVVDSIKKVAKNDMEIVRDVYYWVQNNMKYIAFEDGLGGQVPREANDVFAKRYGDCKDFASLITTMSNAAGVNTYLTWIGSRGLPYTYQQLPLGYSSDHMIAAAFLNGKWIFIDGTSKHTPFGVPSGFIQGKEAMISINPDSFEIVKVPVMPPSFSRSDDSIYLTLDNTLINGKANTTLHGYSRSYMVDALYYTGIDKINDQLKKYMSVGNNKCEVTDIHTNDYTNNDSALKINYSFKLPDYAKAIEDELFINLHLRKHFSQDKIDTTGQRIAPKDIQYTYENRSVVVLEVPKGYQVKKIPENAANTFGDINYRFNYAQRGGYIYFTSFDSYNKLFVQPNEFETWNKQIEALAKIYKDNIILTKIKK
ncbi:MAG: DUF3857 domain-containing protein [Bacteroidota bacterium]